MAAQGASLNLYKGGEELRRAVAALAGPNAEHREHREVCHIASAAILVRMCATEKQHAVMTQGPLPPTCRYSSCTDICSAEPHSAALHMQGERPASFSDPSTSAASNAAQLIPISVKSADHSTRELAFAAQRYAKAAQKDPSDYESVYNHGLALQELASRMASSRTEQMQLLQQVAAHTACGFSILCWPS